MLERTDAEYRALLTDVNLPPGELTGSDVAKRAQELCPEIPVIYMTGAAAHDWTSKGVPNSVLVAKPFAAAQISRPEGLAAGAVATKLDLAPNTLSFHFDGLRSAGLVTCQRAARATCFPM